MEMNFNPNGQGVFLLGQLVLDYTSVDGLHNRDHVRMNSPYGNEFSGDGPQGHTFNPDAEEFHPTSESKVPLNGNMNPTTAYPEHYEVRVFNTPLATHLQFPQEVPYYGYPARPGFQHHHLNNQYHHHHHQFVPGTPTTTILHPSPHPPHPAPETCMRENSDGVPTASIISAPPPPIFSSTNYPRTMDWTLPSCEQSYMCPHIPSPLHVASSVHACPGTFSNCSNINIDGSTLHNSLSSSSLPLTSYVPVYTGDNNYMIRRNDQHQPGILGEGEGFVNNGNGNKGENPDLLVLLSSSAVGEPISQDPSRTASPTACCLSDDDGSSISTSPLSVTTTKSNHSHHQYLMTVDDTIACRNLNFERDNDNNNIPIVNSHELQQVEDSNDDEYEFSREENKLEFNPKALPFFPTATPTSSTSITNNNNSALVGNNNNNDNGNTDGDNKTEEDDDEDNHSKLPFLDDEPNDEEDRSVF